MQDRNSGIDVLRGVAILLVMQLHMLTFPMALNEMGAPAWVIGILRYGWAGVEIFFVMSAYLLTSNLLRHRGESNLAGAFYIRRALRILPLYGILLLIGSRTRAWWLSSGGDEHFWLWINQPPMIFYVLFLQNWITGVIGPFAHFYSPTWSLAVEEHFYLGLPLLVIWLSPRRLFWLSVALIVSGPIMRTYLVNMYGPASAYYWSIAHMDAFSWGLLIALAQHFRPDLLKRISPRRSSLLAAALIIFASFAAPEMRNYNDSTLGVTLAALAGAFALLAAIPSRAAQEKTPSFLARSLAWCGRHCYSLYLLHMPIMGMTFIAAGWKNPPHATDGGLPIIMIAVATTFFIAALTYRWIELPFMSLADRFAPYARARTGG
jgi:peptidoglycan/LPS O-acetylase OafA/YrhL